MSLGELQFASTTASAVVAASNGYLVHSNACSTDKVKAVELVHHRRKIR